MLGEEPRSELRPDTDSSHIRVNIPWWNTCRQLSVTMWKPLSLACPPNSTESPAGPFHLLFLSTGLQQISQFYIYLNLLLAKNQVSPLRVPSVWVFIYSFINIYPVEHLLCVRSSVRCWECSSKDRHSLCFSVDYSLTRDAV